MTRKKMSRPLGKARIVFHRKEGSDNVKNKASCGGAGCDFQMSENETSCAVVPVHDVFQKSSATTMQYKYPVKLLVPEYASTNDCRWVYFMSYGGGLVEGDDLSLELEVHDHCSVVLTTQASTKVYHCEGGKTTIQSISYTVGPGGLLAILPDPVVPFKQAKYVQKQKVSMTVNSNLVLLDWLTAGRIARGEVWQMDSVKTVNQIEVDGEMVFREAQLLQDTATQLVSTAMRGYQVVGMLILLGPELESLSAHIQTVVGKQKSFDAKYTCNSVVSVSALHYTVTSGTIKGCVVRFVADSTSKIQELIENLLQPLFPVLGGNPLDH